MGALAPSYCAPECFRSTSAKITDIETDPNALRSLLVADAAELAELDAAARRFRLEGDTTGRAEALERLAGKLRAALQVDVLRRTEPDVALLMETEGVAIRPGPRPQVPEATLRGIRDALLKFRRVRLVYQTGVPIRRSASASSSRSACSTHSGPIWSHAWSATRPIPRCCGWTGFVNSRCSTSRSTGTLCSTWQPTPPAPSAPSRRSRSRSACASRRRLRRKPAAFISVLLQIFGVFEYKQELCVSYPARE